MNKQKANNITVSGAAIIACMAMLAGTLEADAQLPEAAVVIGFGSPQAIDGKKADGEWASAYQADIPIVLPDKKMATARLYLMNDDTNLYVAIEFDSADEVVRQSFYYWIAGENGKDYGFQNDATDAEPMTYYDGFRSIKGPNLDTEQGGHNDGSGQNSRTDKVCFYEFSKPLVTQDPKTDVQLEPGKSYSFGINLRLIDDKLAEGAEYPEGYGETKYPPAGKEMLIRIAASE